MWESLPSILTVLAAGLASLATTYLSVRQFGAQRAAAIANQQTADEKSRTDFRDEVRKENKDMREELGRVRTNLAEVMDQHMKCKIETAELKIEVMILKSRMGEPVVLPQMPQS